MADLRTTYLGIPLRNPLIAASSGLCESLTGIKLLEENGIGAVVLKSLFEEEILMDMQANLSRISSAGFTYPETLEFYESHDNLRESTADYLDLIRTVKAGTSIPIIASVNCISAQQWTYFPRQMQDAGADALELNLFILPSDLKRSAAENEQIYLDIVAEIRKQVRIPIALKVSYYFSNLAAFLKKLSGTGIQGLVLFNRFYQPDIDIEKMEVSSAGVFSTASDMSISLRWIAILANRLDCDLAASTGVHDGKAVIKQLLAGAQAVQLASVLYQQGPEFIRVMLDELQIWMERKKFSDIDSFRGMLSQSLSSNPAAFERVQFMRYFRGYHPEALPPEYI
jgi:dihydroorotate dehydrogenase (fumarate)